MAQTLCSIELQIVFNPGVPPLVFKQLIFDLKPLTGNCFRNLFAFLAGQ